MPASAVRSAIVIGGGPAGSLTALLLARSGIQVRLLERSAKPHDKVCGECLSGLGLDVLSRAGLLGKLDALGPVRLTRARLCPAGSRSVEVPLPRVSYGISRVALDSMLLTAAADAGVAVTPSARCESIEPGHPPAVVWRDLVINTVRTDRPDLAVLADGKGQLLRPDIRPTGDLGIKTHFPNLNIPQDVICLFSGPGWYGGFAAVEAGRCNAAFSVRTSRVREFGGNIGGLFTALLLENRSMADAVGGASLPSSWLSSPLARFPVAKTWPAGVMAVGNAAAAIEPIGGEGMGAALRSAELSVEAAVSRPQGGNGKLNRVYAPRRMACRALAEVFKSPACSRIAAGLASRLPRVTSYVARGLKSSRATQ
jgi:flavin-dependent dehydrogenase